ncbi:MAG: phosphorylase [Holophagaceae bacterium]
MKYVLGAFPPELGSWLNTPPMGWHSHLTGIGGLYAGLTVQALLHAHPISKMVFIGTCGSFDLQRYPIGTLVEVSEATTRSLGEKTGHSFRLPDETIRWSHTWSLGSFPLVRAVCPPAITQTVSAAHELASFGVVEHLEVAGVFAACHHYSIPVTACLIVANEVGPEGHEQWKTHHHTLMETLRTELLPLLD